jgi:hypothetical protein
MSDAQIFSLPLAGRVREGGDQLETQFQSLNSLSQLHPPTPNPSREGRGTRRL